MNFWNNFAAKHPAAAKWVREGGLFVIVSNLITVFKYLLLQFLPKAFASLPVVDFGWPGIDITLFGETFKWNILGYDAAHGGLPYFCAYMVAMVIGECINFPIQRSLVFRSKGSLAKQIGWYLLAFCLITCIVNSINCIWVAVAGLLVPDFIYNESLYSIPGMGGLLVTCVQRHDNTMVQGIVLLYACVGIIGLILGDLLMVLIDPRISFGKKEGGR